MSQTITLDPLTRVEGHGRISLILDNHNRVQQARLHIVEFRGFEKFIQGRPYWEAPVLVQRLCGICPVSHHLAAAKAVDQLVGVDRLPPAAEKLRRLLHYGQILQSHALHFFYLSTPDLLFGVDHPIAQRNIVGILASYPDIALQGIRLRKYGQEVIRFITGKRVHGTVALPGGMNKALTPAEVSQLRQALPPVLESAVAAVGLAKRLFLSQLDFSQLGWIATAGMGLVDRNGALEFYDGNLRVTDANGTLRYDQLPCQNYADTIQEEVKSWSYMKFPFLREYGPEDGWYRVGPLARLNNCSYLTTPLAEQQRQDFLAHGPQHAPLAYHWARMIELLHSAELIQQLLPDADLCSADLITQGTPRQRGIGVIEAPRGTLIHDYQIDDEQRIVHANLIVSTTHNNQAMNQSITQAAAQVFTGRVLEESLFNRLETVVRAYDPCLSCATHALGKMPLKLELLDAQGHPLDCLVKDSQGVHRLPL